MGVINARALAAAVLMSAAFMEGAAAEEEPASLTLMTYNIHVGIPMGHEFGKYTVNEADLRAIADVITSASADVVAMQEVDCEFAQTLPVAKRRTSALNEPRLLSHMTGLSYVFGSAQDDIAYPSDNAKYVEWGTADLWTNNGAPHGEVGNALLSSVPCKSPPENLPLPKQQKKERRACLRVELERSGKTAESTPIVIYATHLQHDSASARAEQMEYILGRASREPSDSTVFILGDLNHTSRDSLVRQAETTAPDLLDMAAEAGFFDLHQVHSDDTGTTAAMTYPADNPVERIDYILCNRRLKVLSAAVMHSLASDHLPLVVQVELPLQKKNARRARVRLNE